MNSRLVSLASRLSRSVPGAAFALVLYAGSVDAQTATIYGSLANFDVINHIGRDAHGFEIQLEGLQLANIAGSFSYERYGAARVIPYATGVSLRWESPYDASAQQFTQTTMPHAPNTGFAGTCYIVGVGYATSGCEHFGVSLYANALKTTYRWLVEDPTAPGALMPVDPPLAIAAPVYILQPPAAVGNPPVLVAVVQAPEPAETPELYGNAQWMKVFVTQLVREVTLEELLSDNAIVPQDTTQIEVNWDVIQAEPAAVTGAHKRSRKQNQGNIDPTTRSVVRRYELYNYTGTYDPVTHEALCADLTCSAPGGGELGELISAQMTAANVQADSVTVTKTGLGNVDSADKRISCGNKCVAPYIADTVVTLTAKAASGSVFSGWIGACTGASATCTVAANGHVDVGATFTAAPAGGGGGGGGSTVQFTLSIGRSNKGTVTSAPAGINCGSACSAKFASGAVITITATPPAGLAFLGWSGGCSGTAPTCDVAMSKDTSVQANFSK
jgi:Divergent InlB B-repeat domain